MVSHDSLVRAEKRLGVPAVIGRYHKAPERQLQDDYQLGDKVREGWLGQAVHCAGCFRFFWGTGHFSKGSMWVCLKIVYP